MGGDNNKEIIDRKKDHIDLAFSSQVSSDQMDQRFNYDPILAGHPAVGPPTPFSFIGKQFLSPIWVSSMTGGTGIAKNINQNLARACKQFGLGMGLGSCRPILFDQERLADFDVRPMMGDQPLYANLGIAQIEELLDQGQQRVITDLIDRLSADGLIVHVNPMQEWLQPEGDQIRVAPIDTIKRLLDIGDLPIIVKEVGQGFGPASMRALMELPLTAIEFAANGGTNFALLEMARANDDVLNHRGLALIGHTADEMVDIVNDILKSSHRKNLCQNFIISGGIKDYLTGYYYTQKLNRPAVYGQASTFLKHALNDYEELERFVYNQVEGLKLAQQFLSIKEHE